MTARSSIGNRASVQRNGATSIPAGPTCHLDRNSCFDRNVELPGSGFVGQLESIIEDRMKYQASKSYTAQLVNAGVHRIAQKLGAEGVKVALAATKDDHEEIICETADLIYHVLVLLHHQDLSFRILHSDWRRDTGRTRLWVRHPNSYGCHPYKFFAGSSCGARTPVSTIYVLFRNE